LIFFYFKLKESTYTFIGENDKIYSIINKVAVNYEKLDWKICQGTL